MTVQTGISDRHIGTDHKSGPADLWAQRSTRPGQTHVILFLSLHLILLAFFLVLNALSTIETDKARRVLSTVAGTFVRGGTGIDAARTQYLKSFEGRVTEALVPTIPLSKIGTVSEKGDLDAELPLQTFFPGDSVVMRDPLPLLDRLVAVVSTPPEGYRYELNILIRTPEGAGRYPTTMTPDVARAGELSRALISRGMPETNFAVGLEAGDPNAVRFRFYLIEQGERSVIARPLQEDAP